MLIDALEIKTLFTQNLVCNVFISSRTIKEIGQEVQPLSLCFVRRTSNKNPPPVHSD